MSFMYANVPVAPRKKRARADQDDDSYNFEFTKKIRLAPPTPPTSVSRKGDTLQDLTTELPHHLSRLHSIHTGIQHALSHALATCAVSPTADTGIVRNVLNHLSLTTYTGLATQFNLDDLRRLCWLWEWDAVSLDSLKNRSGEEEDPFLDPPKTNHPKDWTRGSMGIIISPATHYSKIEGKRVPAYGIGIEVDSDICRATGGGMSAVAKWTAASEDRRAEVRRKLLRWVELQKAEEEDLPFPRIPLADLPKLNGPAKMSSLTRVFASMSPSKDIGSSSKLLIAPPTPKSPVKSKRTPRDFVASPFPVMPSSMSTSPTKDTFLFPSTPPPGGSRKDSDDVFFSTPSDVYLSDMVQQLSADPQTPTTSRRQALYERVRQRSLLTAATKAPRSRIATLGSVTKDEMLRLSQEEMRRRCLLGRLGGVAESVWMLFASPTASTSASPSKRKRRTLPMAEVSGAIIKSSPVPVSAAEANESLDILVELCPFFLRKLTITHETWLEMPADSEGSKISPSPGRLKDSAEDIVTRSPRRVKRVGGGLREVREIIRRELELSSDF